MNPSRDALQNNVSDLTAAEESEASQQISAATNDNIRPAERATPPTAGKSLRGLVLVLALQAFTALCGGLLRMFLRPGMADAASASRTRETLPGLNARRSNSLPEVTKVPQVVFRPVD